MGVVINREKTGQQRGAKLFAQPVREQHVGDRIDFEAVRHRLKLLRDTGKTELFENRDDVPCPVCGEPFDEVLATAERSRQLAPNEPLDVCLVREPERMILFTHAREQR
jgi:hypothetical protein